MNNLSAKTLAKKILVGLVVILLIFIFINFVYEASFSPPDIKYGVSFSPQYAKRLGLPWQTVYLESLNNLKVKQLRLPTYWSVVEPQPGQFDFSETDFMLENAEAKDAKVILGVGAKQPRWPECHYPDWAKKLTETERRQKTLEFIRETITRYKNYPAITGWQVENEPLLPRFGEGCDPPDTLFLKSEVDLVRKLSQKPVYISSSGELETWIGAMQLSDILGISLYRTVYNPIVGYLTYPLSPLTYNLKSSLARKFFAPDNQKTIITELQAEPWAPDNNLQNLNIQKQISLFPLEKFQTNVRFAQKTGFDEIYLWGTEWWYYMKEKGHPEYWEYAKTLF